eukprot:SAG31_NODE_82_length_27046_cov_45.857275_20_plen_84_part_00
MGQFSHGEGVGGLTTWAEGKSDRGLWRRLSGDGRDVAHPAGYSPTKFSTGTPVIRILLYALRIRPYYRCWTMLHLIPYLHLGT